MSETWYTRLTCRLCDSPVLSALKLKPAPLANNYTKEPVEQERYPLELMQCVQCKHVQLGIVVDPKILYSDYRYRSGVGSKEYFKSFANSVTWPEGLVVEIASNDGTLMREFERLGHKVVGIDPAGTYKNVPHFFCEDMVTELIDTHGKAQIVVACNVMAHVDDLRGFVRGVKKLLADDGVFVFEVQYLRDLIEGQRFDLIYHEHLDYHHLGPLKTFLESEGLHIYSIRQTEAQGGSLRVFCRHERDLLEYGIDYFVYHEEIDISQLKIPENPVAGISGPVVAYGACAKTTGLICQTGARFQCIVDDTPEKQGMYAPTGHYITNPGDGTWLEDYAAVYIAAWNFADEIKRRHPHLNYV